MSIEESNDQSSPLTSDKVKPLMKRICSRHQKNGKPIRHHILAADFLEAVYNHYVTQEESEEAGYEAVANVITAIGAKIPFDELLNNTLLQMHEDRHQGDNPIQDILSKNNEIINIQRRAALKKGVKMLGLGVVAGASVFGGRVGLNDLLNSENAADPSWKEYAINASVGGAALGVVAGVRAAYSEFQNRKDFHDFPVDKALEHVEVALQLRINELQQGTSRGR